MEGKRQGRGGEEGGEISERKGEVVRSDLPPSLPMGSGSTPKSRWFQGRAGV